MRRFISKGNGLSAFGVPLTGKENRLAIFIEPLRGLMKVSFKRLDLAITDMGTTGHRNPKRSLLRQ